VVHVRRAEAQAHLLVRAGADEPVPPGWEAHPVGLEELALAYLREPGAAALPGPVPALIGAFVGGRWKSSEDVLALIVDGQIAAAVAQGIGGALYEHLIYDEDGNLSTGTLLDHLRSATRSASRSTGCR